MNTRMIYPFLILLLTYVTGCTTPRESQPIPLTAKERELFFSRAQDERRFWLTRYEASYGPVFAGGHRLHTDKQTLVPFATRRNATAPAISIRLRSPNEQLALIDTSLRGNWIEFGLATDEGLIPIGPPPHRLFATHVRDPIPGYLSAASRMSIDQLFIDTALFYVKGAHGPMTDLTRNNDDLRAPIVLGSDFLRAFSFVRIDFNARTVHFSTTIPYPIDPDQIITSAPMLDLNGTIAVEGFLDETHTLFLLDSLGDYHIAAEELDSNTVRQVMINHLVMRNVPATDTHSLALGFTDLPRIGRNFLESFIIVFDNQKRLIHFERPLTQ